MDAKLIGLHQALAKRISAVNADARKLLETGNNVGHVVRQLTEAQQLIERRLRALETSPAAPENT